MFKAFVRDIYIYLNFATDSIPKFDIQSVKKIGSAPIVALLWLYNSYHITTVQPPCLHVYQQSQSYSWPNSCANAVLVTGLPLCITSREVSWLWYYRGDEDYQVHHKKFRGKNRWNGGNQSCGFLSFQTSDEDLFLSDQKDCFCCGRIIFIFFQKFWWSVKTIQDCNQIQNFCHVFLSRSAATLTAYNRCLKAGWELFA